MSLLDVFIQRPVLTWMLTLSLLVFGVLGYNRLGVDQFPSMEFPVVMVAATMEGASPEVMEQDVTDVLEEHINTIAGVRELRSKSGQGSSVITVEFELGVDIDIAAQDVRDKLARARGDLPTEVEQPVVDKINPANFPVMWVPLKSDRHPVEVSEFIRLQVKPKLETIEGVASIQIFGQLDREIRIWLDGESLRARGLAATDVLAAFEREHVEVPGGLVEGQELEYAVKTDAEFRRVDELANMIVAYVDGAPVRLADVARVQDGAEDVRTIAHYDGRPAVGVGIVKQSDGNTVAVVDEVKQRLAEIQKTLPPDMLFRLDEGVADFSVSIREAVEETIFSLQFGALLATFTVFVFLRRWRPTLIVGLAIPISLITTFGVMWALGYTLNTMTLLAMTLAVGVVIDDAIVVLENIERHREAGEDPKTAASKGTRQIAFAATAATFSIAAVFLPVVFTEGLVGNFLGEFGATVACAVIVSLVVALTLTPMLAARVPPAKERARGSVYHWLEVGLSRLEAGYTRILDWTLSHRLATMGMATAAFFGALFVGGSLGGEFFPSSDEGRFFIEFQTPPGTSVDGTLAVMQQNERWVLAQPEVAGLFAGAGTGRSDSGPPQPTEGVMFAILKSRDQRDRSAQELVAAAREALGSIPGQKIKVADMSGMMMSGGDGDFSVNLRGNVDLQSLDSLADDLIARLEQQGGFVDLDKSLKLGRPELRVRPDREKAAALGVDARTLATTIQAMIGGLDIATFKEAGNRYDIRVRLDEGMRADPASIERLYARTRDGGVVELRNLVDVEKGAAPSSITRVDRQRSVTVSGNLQGKPLAQAIEEAQAVGAEILPEGVTMSLSGQAEAFAEGAQQFVLALGLAILVIYMILAAQFESMIHPLTVMMALPLAMVGALGGLWLFGAAGKPGMTLNLFSMIGIILLFGLVTKNSILLVDYANQLRATGLDKVAAMRKAAPIRMRPVLMTALSMILGVAPAALGIGPGSESRAPMAVAAGMGMFSSTVLTLLVVPVFYLVLDDVGEWIRGKVWRGSKPAEEAGEPVRIGA
ncbi:MAG: efflux RND transporter permease subunit [Myxococcota bacterium]|nr:efflux RND transporter permease subunit [Myxococcota bacterium]